MALVPNAAFKPAIPVMITGLDREGEAAYVEQSDAVEIPRLGLGLLGAKTGDISSTSIMTN